MKPIRIGNVEYRESVNPFSNKTYEEVVLWFTNPHYGSEERLKDEGYVFDENGNASCGNVTIHSGCFLNEQSCCTIADIEWNGAHDEFDVRSIGLRAFELSEEDRKDMMRVLKMIWETIDD